MSKKRLLKHLVFLMFFLFVLNLMAQEFYWYFTIWYFDMIMHFLSGFWVALFFVWFFSMEDMGFLQLSLEKIDFKLFRKIILFVLSIGVLWELFEFYVYQYIGQIPFHLLNTVSDICFDLLGGICAMLYLLVPLKNQQKGN